MTTHAAALLQELSRAGVSVTIAAHDPGALDVEGPADVLTPEQVNAIRACKPALLDLLRAEGPVANPHSATPGTPKVSYTAEERRLLADAPEVVRETIENVKRLFGDLADGVTLLDIRPDPDWPRHRLEVMIDQAEQRGDQDLARRIRDTWQERIALCMIDRDLSESDAEQVALKEIEAIMNG